MFPVAREGRLSIVTTAAAAAVVHSYWNIYVALPLWLLVLLLLFFLRDFPRQTPPVPLGNVSPIDGVVVSVESVEDPYLKRPATRIRLKQNLLGEFNVHSPVEGKVEQRWWPRRGEGLPDQPLSEFAIWIRTDEDDDVVMAVNVATALHYLHCSVQSGERVGQGRRCGLVGFGCRVDLYLPENARTPVVPGQRVKAGLDVIGSFVHS